MRVGLRWEKFFSARMGKGGFLVWKVGGSIRVARTVGTFLWKNSDFFHEPKQHYEEILELGDSSFPLMVDSEINS